MTFENLVSGPIPRPGLSPPPKLIWPGGWARIPCDRPNGPVLGSMACGENIGLRGMLGGTAGAAPWPCCMTGGTIGFCLAPGSAEAIWSSGEPGLAAASLGIVIAGSMALWASTPAMAGLSVNASLTPVGLTGPSTTEQPAWPSKLAQAAQDIPAPDAGR